MSYRKIIGTCSTWDASGEPTEIDYSQILENLFLFDSFIMQSNRMKELPHFIYQFGPNGTKALLKHGGLKLLFNPTFITSPNSAEKSYAHFQNGTTIINGVDFGLGKLIQLNEIISKEMNAGLARVGMAGKPGIKIKESFSIALLPFDANEGESTHASIKPELLGKGTLVKQAISLVVAKKNGVELDPENIRVEFEFIEEFGYRVTTNLPDLLRIEPKEARSIIVSAVLALSDMNLMFERMAKHKATATLRESDIKMLDYKMDSLYSIIDPSGPKRALHRVTSLAGLPNFSAFDFSSEKNIQHFVEIRNSSECCAFRKWLSESEFISDEELSDMMMPIRSRIGVFFNSSAGKSLRWAASTSVGFAPGGTIVGPMLSAVDTFLLDTILPSKGPVAFLGAHYASLFK